MEEEDLLVLGSRIKQVKQTIKDLENNMSKMIHPETYIEQYNELLQTKKLLIDKLKLHLRQPVK